MVLNSFLFLFTTFLLPASELTEMVTKQDIRNLRYVTNDGKFTYYQRRSGSLIFSTNYKIKEILKGNIGTQYNIIEGSNDKLIIIQDNNYHTLYNVRKPLKIFTVLKSNPNPKEIGKGVTPILHLNDTWISYYSYQKKTIYFKALIPDKFNFKIQLKNNFDPYFIPSIIMLNEKEILYNDIGESGHQALLALNRKTNKVSVVYQYDSPLRRFSMCNGSNNFYINEYGVEDVNNGTLLSQINKADFDFTKRKIIYESKKNDLSNIICHLKDDIYFIKNTNNNFEVAKISKNKPSKALILTKSKYITQIISMDKKLILPFRGKFYLLKGENNLNKTDLLYEAK